MSKIQIALCQINPIVGDLQGNAEKIIDYITRHDSSDVIVFPELALIGYPPEDLVHNSAFLSEHNKILDTIVFYTSKIKSHILLSTAYRLKGELYNCILVISDGKINQAIPKIHLPNYSVFDEKRLFTQGKSAEIFEINNIKLGVLTCEDLWFADVSKELLSKGAQVLLSLNASPYDIKKIDSRNGIIKSRNNETHLPIIYLNLVGGQDELVFDGRSFIVDKYGNTIHVMKAWQEDAVEINISKDLNISVQSKIHKVFSISQEYDIYSALMLGLKDYTRKNGFKKVLLGLSGGVDSALTAVIAVDALGSENVRCVRLPSMYSSDHSLTDAEELAVKLGVHLDTVDIEAMYHSIESSLNDVFKGLSHDITEENIQARIRGVVLMAMSNKFNSLLLTTGNKSEVAVGYATLYGDMCGSFSLLKDIYKTSVFNLSNWRNKNKPDNALGPSGIVIPRNIIVKPPSAELREGQKDSDSLPEYDILDDILKELIEKETELDKIVNQGYDIELVKRISNLLFVAEYKRFQAAPGVRITTRNLSRDRRYPITNKFRFK
ncbi:MAG: NAD+ synthase [Rickettsiales bacterium]|nr:NAD+ synthase [Rickettsiales bacterium]